jgi:two-component system, chemotaxis family, CheB/CheR fusion protein
VIVNDALEILQFRGRTSPYLEPASGRANLNILNMVCEELAIALRTAIASARKRAVTVHKKNVPMDRGGKRRVVHLSVIPMDEPATGMGRCYLILFEDAAPPIEIHDKKSQSGPLKASDRVRRELLEQKRELQAARALLKDHLAEQGIMARWPELRWLCSPRISGNLFLPSLRSSSLSPTASSWLAPCISYGPDRRDHGRDRSGKRC